VDSMACWFLPTSECEAAPHLVGERPGCREHGRGGGTEPRGRPCIQKIIAENRSLNSYSLMNMKSDAEGHPQNVPAAWRHKGHFWYTSQLLGFMLNRPNAHFGAILAEAKRAAGFDALERPLLSLHVRRGDSCNPEQVGRSAQGRRSN